MPKKTSTPADFGPRFDAMHDALQASSRVRIYESTRLPLTPQTDNIDTVGRDLSIHAKVSMHADLRQCWLPFARFSLHWESVATGNADTQGVVGGEMALTYLFDVATQDADLVTEGTA